MFPWPYGRPKKVDHDELLEFWDYSRKLNPKYTKALLAKRFKVSRSCVDKIIRNAEKKALVKQGLEKPSAD